MKKNSGFSQNSELRIHCIRIRQYFARFVSRLGLGLFNCDGESTNQSWTKLGILHSNPFPARFARFNRNPKECVFFVFWIYYYKGVYWISINELEYRTDILGITWFGSFLQGCNQNVTNIYKGTQMLCFFLKMRKTYEGLVKGKLHGVFLWKQKIAFKGLNLLCTDIKDMVNLPLKSRVMHIILK